VLLRTAPQGPALSLDGLIRVGRIIRIVLEPTRARYARVLALLDRLPLVPIRVLHRVARAVLAGRNDGFVTHGVLLRFLFRYRMRERVRRHSPKIRETR
jgi:hypothetical protein